MHSIRFCDPTSLRGPRWLSGRAWNSVAINIGWVSLFTFQWPKVGLTAAKWIIEKSVSNFASVFSLPFSKSKQILPVVFAVFQGRYPRAITMQPIKAVAKDRHQSYFRKFGNFFSEKQQSAVRTDQKIIYFLSTISAWR